MSQINKNDLRQNIRKKIHYTQAAITLQAQNMTQSSLWRNRLARSAVNRKVGGSSPPRDDFFYTELQTNFLTTFGFFVINNRWLPKLVLESEVRVREHLRLRGQ